MYIRFLFKIVLAITLFVFVNGFAAEKAKFTVNYDNLNNRTCDILGWSKDGKVAIVEQHKYRDKDGDYCESSFIITEVSEYQNEIVKIESHYFDGFTIINKYRDFKSFWLGEQSNILKSLEDNLIIPVDDKSFEPVRHLEEKYNYTIDISYDYWEDGSTDAQIKIINKYGDSRELVSLISYQFKCYIQGFNKSPYENKIVLLVVTVNCGGRYAGFRTYDTAFCHLGVGFEQSQKRSGKKK